MILHGIGIGIGIESGYAAYRHPPNVDARLLLRYPSLRR